MNRRRSSLQVVSAFLIAGAIGLFYQNCAPQGTAIVHTPTAIAPKPDEVSSPKLQEMNAAVDSLANQDLSCTKAEDCTAIAVGARACGGPQRYVVTSLNNPVLPQVESSAEDLTQAERVFNRALQNVSICSVVMPPTLACDNAKCVGDTDRPQ